MSSGTIANTNIRVGPGVYAAMKQISEKTGLSIGACANLWIIISLYNVDKTLSSFGPEIQKALVADMLSVLSDFLKIASIESVKNTSFDELYRNLFGQQKS